MVSASSSGLVESISYRYEAIKFECDRRRYSAGKEEIEPVSL